MMATVGPSPFRLHLDENGRVIASLPYDGGQTGGRSKSQPHLHINTSEPHYDSFRAVSPMGRSLSSSSSTALVVVPSSTTNLHSPLRAVSHSSSSSVFEAARLKMTQSYDPRPTSPSPSPFLSSSASSPSRFGRSASASPSRSTFYNDVEDEEGADGNQQRADLTPEALGANAADSQQQQQQQQQPPPPLNRLTSSQVMNRLGSTKSGQSSSASTPSLMTPLVGRVPSPSPAPAASGVGHPTPRTSISAQPISPLSRNRFGGKSMSMSLDSQQAAGLMASASAQSPKSSSSSSKLFANRFLQRSQSVDLSSTAPASLASLSSSAASSSMPLSSSVNVFSPESSLRSNASYSSASYFGQASGDFSSSASLVPDSASTSPPAEATMNHPSPSSPSASSYPYPYPDSLCPSYLPNGHYRIKLRLQGARALDASRGSPDSDDSSSEGAGVLRLHPFVVLEAPDSSLRSNVAWDQVLWIGAVVVVFCVVWFAFLELFDIRSTS
jgi:hypothetical protein